MTLANGSCLLDLANESLQAHACAEGKCQPPTKLRADTNSMGGPVNYGVRDPQLGFIPMF